MSRMLYEVGNLVITRRVRMKLNIDITDVMDDYVRSEIG